VIVFPNVSVYIKERYYVMLYEMSKVQGKSVSTICKEIIEKYLDGEFISWKNIRMPRVKVRDVS
jgi:hypothetical protein